MITVAGGWGRAHWRSVVAWAVGLVVVVLLYVPLYPQYARDGLLEKSMAALPPELVDALGLSDIASPAGYLNATVFGLMGALLLLIAAITYGAEAIAGDEEAGLLELEASKGVSRTGVLAGRSLAVVVSMIVLTTALTAVIVGLAPSSGLAVPAGRIVAAGAALGLLATFHAMLALSVGAVTGRVGTARALAIMLALAGYLVSTLGVRGPSWLPKLSPFHWASGNQPLENGLSTAGAAYLGLGVLLLAVVAWLGFGNRDVGR